MILFGVYRNTSLFSINLRWSCFLYAAVNIFIFVLQYLFRVFSSFAVVCCHLTNNLCHLFVKDKKIYNTSQLFVYFSSSWGIFTYVFFLFVRAERISFIKGVVSIIIIDIWNWILFCHAHWVPFTSPSVMRVKLSIGLQASMSL